jgi:hypothetical protein
VYAAQIVTLPENVAVVPSSNAVFSALIRKFESRAAPGGTSSVKTCVDPVVATVW